jgi:hypothetical protein
VNTYQNKKLMFSWAWMYINACRWFDGICLCCCCYSYYYCYYHHHNHHHYLLYAGYLYIYRVFHDFMS